MKTAVDYPVTFGYGAQDGKFYGPNGSVALSHRGNDRSCPTGVPIVIEGVTIGFTGASGTVGGPHLHTQAGTDQACQRTVDPTPFEFKAGTVVAVRPVDSGAWGRFVTLKVGSHYITYAHLQSVKVSVNQVIEKGEEPMNDGDIDNMLQAGWGRPATQEEKDRDRGKAFKAAFYDYMKPQFELLRGALADVQSTLANEQAKPPREVVKEVDRIVTQYVEVTKEVEQVDTRNPIQKIVDAIKQLFKRS